MSRKAKYTKEQKLEIVKRYLSGEGSIVSLAREIGAAKDNILQWVTAYRYNGEEALNSKTKNSTYSKQYKIQAVEDYFTIGSIRLVSAKYKISNSVLRKWIKEYNNGNLKDYNPMPEVYSMKGRRTTFEERKEIVQYCLAHDKNYKEAAKVYALPYSRVYTMVKAYIEEGEEGLMTAKQREATKPLTELEKLQKENEKLKKQLELEKLKNEMWQKKTELEKQRIQEYKMKMHTKR